MQFTPLCCKRAMTFDQQEPSANSPCTKYYIRRLQRSLGAGDSIEQGNGGTSSDSPDQCSAVHHSLLLQSFAPYEPKAFDGGAARDRH